MSILVMLAALPAAAQPVPELAVTGVVVVPDHEDAEDGVRLEVTLRNDGVFRTEPVTVQLGVLLAADLELEWAREEVHRWIEPIELQPREERTYTHLVPPWVTHDPVCYPYLGVKLHFDDELDTGTDNNLALIPFADCDGPSFAPPVQPELPNGFVVTRTWWASDLGLPDKLGGMVFTENGSRLLVVGAADSYDSAVYSLYVGRDPATRSVVTLGPATFAFDTRYDAPPERQVGMSAGLERGPIGLLTNTSWGRSELRERPNDPEERYYPPNRVVLNQDPVLTGLAMSPQRGEWVASTWPEPWLFLLPESDFLRYRSVHLADLPHPVGGLAFVPAGAWQGDLLYADWIDGTIVRVDMDPATGFPLDATTGVPTLGAADPRRSIFATGLSRGPWGLEFDPLTDDLLVSTWTHGEDDQILLVYGGTFDREAPIAEDAEYYTLQDRPIDIRFAATDADSPAIFYDIVDGPEYGTLDGTPPDLVYTPGALAFWTLHERITFVASDGTYRSEPAVVSIDLYPAAAGCSGCSGGPVGGRPWWLLALGVLALRRRGGGSTTSVA